MAFRVLFLAHAPDANPDKHRCVIETGKYKLYSLVVRRVNRGLYALLAQCDNFYWEFSGTWLYRIVESVCKKFGPEHTLFGSNMPFTTPAVNLMMVTHADIGEEEKKLIAGDNLRRILGNVKES